MCHSNRILCALILPALLAASALRAGEPVEPKVPDKVEPKVPEKAPEKIPMPDFLKSDKDIASYGMGQFIGMQLSQLAPDLDTDAALKSLLEGAAGKPNNLDEKAFQAAMTTLQTFITAKQAASEKKPPEAPKPLADKDKVSYAVGQFFVIRLDLKTFAPDLDMDLLAKGAGALAKGEKPKLDMTDAQKSIQTYLGELEKKKGDKEAAKNKLAGEKNIKEGADFLAENGKKEGVKTTASGLQYKVLKDATGPKPSSAAATVSVHYTGKLLDGTVFDSSVKRGQPAEFPLNGVIPGWTEGLQLMPEGAKFEFYIPSAMAYGPSGRPSIPPNAVLIFEVELLKIVKDGAEPKKELK